LASAIVVFNSNIALRLLFKDKIWAHKVNSIDKLFEVKERFKGVELDVVFVENNEGHFFDVHHPPDKSTGLSLSQYLQSNKEVSQLKYWIDFKNLNQKNVSLSISKLDSIITKFDINKLNIIIESNNPKYLGSFKSKGYITSYYLPENLYKLDSVKLKSKLNVIAKNISVYKHYYISSDYKNYLILNKYFPNSKKIIWFTTYGSVNRFKARFLIYKILLDKKVDVLLIPAN